MLLDLLGLGASAPSSAPSGTAHPNGRLTRAAVHVNLTAAAGVRSRNGKVGKPEARRNPKTAAAKWSPGPKIFILAGAGR